MSGVEWSGGSEDVLAKLRTALTLVTRLLFPSTSDQTCLTSDQTYVTNQQSLSCENSGLEILEESSGSFKSFPSIGSSIDSGVLADQSSSHDNSGVFCSLPDFVEESLTDGKSGFPSSILRSRTSNAFETPVNSASVAIAKNSGSTTRFSLQESASFRWPCENEPRSLLSESPDLRSKTSKFSIVSSTSKPSTSVKRKLPSLLADISMYLDDDSDELEEEAEQISTCVKNTCENTSVTKRPRILSSIFGERKNSQSNVSTIPLLELDNGSVNQLNTAKLSANKRPRLLPSSEKEQRLFAGTKTPHESEFQDQAESSYDDQSSVTKHRYNSVSQRASISAPRLLSLTASKHPQREALVGTPPPDSSASTSVFSRLNKTRPSLTGAHTSESYGLDNTYSPINSASAGLMSTKQSVARSSVSSLMKTCNDMTLVCRVLQCLVNSYRHDTSVLTSQHYASVIGELLR